MHCRHGHRGGLDFIAGQKLVDTVNRTRAKFLSYSIAASAIEIYDRGQMDRFAFSFKLAVDACVIASEGACADYGDVGWVSFQFSVLGCQFSVRSSRLWNAHHNRRNHWGFTKLAG